MKIIGNKIEGSPEELKIFLKDNPHLIKTPLLKRWLIPPIVLFLFLSSVVPFIRYENFKLYEPIETALIILHIACGVWVIGAVYLKFKSRTILVVTIAGCLVILSICFKFVSPKTAIAELISLIKKHYASPK